MRTAAIIALTLLGAGAYVGLAFCVLVIADLVSLLFERRIE